MKTTKNIWLWVGLAALLPAVWLALWLTAPQPVTPVANIQSFAEALESAVSYPQGELFEDSARKEYTDGALRLVVPRMGLDCAVWNGTTPEILEKGPGLYEVAQLPARGNPNVSIAGHRDVSGSPFLKIDKLREGDAIYLVYGDNVYLYRWQQTTIVSPDDWSVIHCVDYSRVTLTSCDPIGTSLNRIVAVGKLQTVEPYTEDYTFT